MTLSRKSRISNLFFGLGFTVHRLSPSCNGTLYSVQIDQNPRFKTTRAKRSVHHHLTHYLRLPVTGFENY